jgi:hypothetical protein
MWFQFSDEDASVAIKALERAGAMDLAWKLRERQEATTSGDWEDIRQQASEEHERDGECEIDDDAVVSASDKGAYVMAWVWVDGDTEVIEGEGDEANEGGALFAGDEGLMDGDELAAHRRLMGQA